jgi:Predicted metal binding domain
VNAGLQVADPSVSLAKFEREVEEFGSLAHEYRRRGWFLVDATFPEVFVVLAAPQVTPPPIVTGVLFDYTNYDLSPPSVRLVNPFTREIYKASELPTTLLRQVEVDAPAIVGLQLPPGAVGAKMVQQQPLMQSFEGPDELPFLCLAGVREYHDHPAHSGDLWELHRRTGAGRLVRLLEVIDTYGVRPLNGYGVNLVPQITGFIQAEVPS